MSERKRKAMLEALATGRMVRVLFTPDAEGVRVPDRFKENEIAVLDFGRRAPTPITDIECTLTAISGTLRFGGEYIWCSVPWLAVIGIGAHGPTPAARAWNPTVIQGGKN